MEERNEFERVFWLAIVLIAVVIVAGVAASYFLTGYAGPGFPYGYGMMGGYAFPVMALFMAVPLLLLFLFIYWIIRVASGPHEIHHYHTGAPQAGEGQGRAMDVLNEKYARGDINREQYLQMKEDMSKR